MPRSNLISEDNDFEQFDRCEDPDQILAAVNINPGPSLGRKPDQLIAMMAQEQGKKPPAPGRKLPEGAKRKRKEALS